METLTTAGFLVLVTKLAFFGLLIYAWRSASRAARESREAREAAEAAAKATPAAEAAAPEREAA
ncbi:MAG: hypothetical protein AAF074_21975 [Pseudomonadota bacterium]